MIQCRPVGLDTSYRLEQVRALEVRIFFQEMASMTYRHGRHRKRWLLVPKGAALLMTPRHQRKPQKIKNHCVGTDAVMLNFFYVLLKTWREFQNMVLRLLLWIITSTLWIWKKLLVAGNEIIELLEAFVFAIITNLMESIKVFNS